MNIHHGEVVGLAGLVSAERSEFAQAIFGMVGPIAGEVWVEGERVPHVSIKGMVRHNVIYCPENRDTEGVVMEMGVEDNITLPNLRHLSRWGCVLAKMSGQSPNRSATLAINADLNDLVSSPSGGNRQKVALARSLACDPQVLILDEPTHGIDIGTKTDIHDLVATLVDKGLAVLLISPDMPELLEMSDRIYVMSRGRMTAELKTDEATQEEIMAVVMGKGGYKHVEWPKQ